MAVDLYKRGEMKESDFLEYKEAREVLENRIRFYTPNMMSTLDRTIEELKTEISELKKTERKRFFKRLFGK